MATLQDLLASKLNQFRNQAFNNISSGINNAAVNIGRSPVGQAVINTQKFIESPKPVELPQMNFNAKPFGLMETPLNVGKFAYNNVVAPTINTIAGQGVINPALDIGNMAGRALRGEFTPYNQVKSAPVRLGYNLSGIENKPQEFIGNIAGSALPAITAYTPSAVKGVLTTPVKGVLNTIKSGALQGAELGGLFGVLQGLSDSRKETLVNQFANGALQGLSGAAIGGAAGAALSTPQAVNQLRQVTAQKISALTGTAEKKQALQLADKFLRDELGRFAGIKKTANEPVFYGDLRESLGLSRNGDYRGGFVKPNEIFGVNSLKYEGKYQKGDVTALEKKLDELLGTDGFRTNEGWKTLEPARQTARDQLEYYAKQGDENAQKVLAAVDDLYSQISDARGAKDALLPNNKVNGKAIKGVKVISDGTQAASIGKYQSQAKYARKFASPLDFIDSLSGITDAAKKEQLINSINKDFGSLENFWRVSNGKQAIPKPQPVGGEKITYRSPHQIVGNTKPANDLNIDEVVKNARAYNGYLTKYDLADLEKLKKIQGNPDMEIKIYRASPVNELNNGDWITTSKTYAQDIKRQNGGKVYEYTVKASDLKYPNDITELPSLARFSAFKYEPEVLSPPTSKVGDVGAIDRTKLTGKQLSVPNENLYKPSSPDLVQQPQNLSGDMPQTAKQPEQLPQPIQPTAKTRSFAELAGSEKPYRGQSQKPSLTENKTTAEMGSSTGSIAQEDKAAADFEKNVLGKGTEDPMYGEANVWNQDKAKLPEVHSDAASVDKARGSTYTSTDPIERFKDWVNSRRATFVEGKLQSKEFTDLDNRGVQGFIDMQSGKDARLKAGTDHPLFDKLGQYFNTKRQEYIKETGRDLGYKKDYIPQLWKNSPEEVEKILGRTLNSKTPFTIERLIKSYDEGIQAGLSPRYNKLSDLVSWYETTANKGIEDARFFKYLAKENIIQTHKIDGFTALDPDKFPKFKVKSDAGEFNGVYYAPDELAKRINNYLIEPTHQNLARLADFTSSTKNKVLSFGVPRTAVNAHGFNILSRNILSSKNPLSGAVTGIKYMLAPSKAGEYLDKEMAKAPFAIDSGLTLSTSEYRALDDGFKTGSDTFLKSKKLGNAKNTIGDVWNKTFEQGLFDKMIPALKLQKFYEVYEGYKKSMPDKEAARAAAKFTNEVFGGINWQELGRSKDTQNLLRSFILAPDWFESTVRIGANIPKSFVKVKDPKMQAYRRFAATFLGSYITMNVVNKLSSGHFMYENDPGHAFEIEAGYTDDGQKRYIRPYGTSVDMFRIPVDVAIGLSKGDLSVPARIIRNRLSTVAGSVFGLATDTDYTGNPVGVRGVDKYGKEMPINQRLAGIGGQLSGIVGVPAFGQQVANYATGKQGPEQTLTQAFELPFRYTGGVYNDQDKYVSGIAKSEGFKGKDLYDFNKKISGEKKFTDNQLEYIKQTGTGGVNDVLDLRKINSDIRKERAAAEDGEDIPKSGDVQAAEPTNNQIKKIGGQYGTRINNSYRLFDSQEEAQKAIDKDTFKKSGQNIQVIGDNVFRLSKGGDVSVTPKIDYATQVNDLLMDNAKTSKDYTGWTKLAQEQLQNYSQQMQDPTLDTLEKLQLQKKIDSLTSSIEKYKTYGGSFTKGKKLKIKKITLKKPKAPKLTPIKLKKIKKLSLKIKAPKTLRKMVS